MAAQPFSPERKSSHAKPSIRHFTLEKANRALPLVKRVVGDIVSTHSKAADLQGKIESLPTGGNNRSTLQEQLETTIDRLQELVGELQDIGCELKDYETGLVDFVGRHKGHDVCLCWKLGEDKIAFFHEIAAGFSGRQPVTLLDEKE
jgi:hypothetical protein